MKFAPLCLIACLVGVVFMAIGWTWAKDSVGGRATWTEADGEAYVKAAQTLHQVAHAHGDQTQMEKQGVPIAAEKRVSDAELKSAQDEWDKQKGKRDAALGWRAFWSGLFKYSGGTLVALGGIGYLIIKNVTEE